MEKAKMVNILNGIKGGFEPDFTWLWVRHSATELPRSYWASALRTELPRSILSYRAPHSATGLPFELPCSPNSARWTEGPTPLSLFAKLRNDCLTSDSGAQLDVTEFPGRANSIQRGQHKIPQEVCKFRSHFLMFPRTPTKWWRRKINKSGWVVNKSNNPYLLRNIRFLKKSQFRSHPGISRVFLVSTEIACKHLSSPQRCEPIGWGD